MHSVQTQTHAEMKKNVNVLVPAKVYKDTDGAKLLIRFLRQTAVYREREKKIFAKYSVQW